MKWRYNDRDQQVMLPFCLEYEILFQMRPNRQAGKRQVLPFRQWKLRSKPNFQLSILVCFRLRERGRQVHGITHGPLRKTKARTVNQNFIQCTLESFAIAAILLSL